MTSSSRVTVFVCLLILTSVCVAQDPSTPNVTMWHNDIGRTGQNNAETVLTTAVVSSTATFGKVCSAPVDAKVYGQPLVVSGVNFKGGGNKTVAYVVTQNDTVYAFDGTNCTQLGTMSLLVNPLQGEIAAQCSDIGTGCGTINPQIGILSTPVIDLSSGTLYAVAQSECPANSQCNQLGTAVFFHRIHALNITTLLEQANSPVQVCGTGCGGVSSTLFSQGHIQRPGLLWLSSTQAGRSTNMVYAAFSMIDGDQTHPPGWIFGFNAQNLSDKSQQVSFETTSGQNAYGGGIWQAGAGLAAGKDDNLTDYYIYLSTADGAFDLNNGGANGADSFLKLTTSLTLAPGQAYFTPSDECYRSSGSGSGIDLDFGSGGTILIPDGTEQAYKHLAVKADKENYLWVMNRTVPGGFNVGQCTPSNPPSNCKNLTVPACPESSWANANLSAFQFIGSNIQNPGQTRATPAYWSGNKTLYIIGTYTPMYQVPLADCSPKPPYVCQSLNPTAMQLGFSSTPSISSNQQGQTFTNGIVWTIKNPSDPPDPSGNGPAVLYAFDATSNSELYDSNKCTSHVDQPGLATKFSVPTISNGHVYIGTQTDFDIYGPITRTACH